MYNCDFCERGFIYRIWTQSRFKLLSNAKRSTDSLSTSKVHDSILRKFVFLAFFGCKGYDYSSGFKCSRVSLLCTFLWKQRSAVIMRIVLNGTTLECFLSKVASSFCRRYFEVVIIQHLLICLFFFNCCLDMIMIINIK